MFQGTLDWVRVLRYGEDLGILSVFLHKQL